MEKFLEMLKELRPNIDFENSENLVEDGSLDSLDIFEIINAIETKIGIKIEGDDIDPDHFITVDKMWELVKKYQKLQ